jgi:hypothetical protein
VKTIYGSVGIPMLVPRRLSATNIFLEGILLPKGLEKAVPAIIHHSLSPKIGVQPLYSEPQGLRVGRDVP